MNPKRILRDAIERAATETIGKVLQPVIDLGQMVEERGRKLGLQAEQLSAEAVGCLAEIRAQATAAIRAIAEERDAALEAIRAARRGEHP
jgi:hypothetical protein